MSKNPTTAKGIRITTKGVSEIVTFKNKFVSLKEMQDIVGGYVEFVYLPDNLIMVVNEEGKMNNLPVNEYINLIYSKIINYIIVGDILLINNKYVN